jgi:plasmid stabilization system protein ParE
MALHTVILSSAKSDIQSASDWYESRQVGLGKQFKQEIIQAIDSILDSRKGYGPVYLNLSRVFVKKFPYVIYFKIDSTRNRVVVYAILNEKQNREAMLRDRI